MKKVKIGPQTLLYPMPAVLVGAQVKGKPNFMTAAWCGIVASAPPAISVALRPARYTLDGISANKTFSILRTNHQTSVLRGQMTENREQRADNRCKNRITSSQYPEERSRRPDTGTRVI